MRRLASNYIYLPELCFLKRYVIEVDAGRVLRLFPLIEEVEDTEWLPGVIVLLPNGMPAERVSFHDATCLPDSVSAEVMSMLPFCIPYLFYPFDFIGKKPFAVTRYTRLG